MHRLLLRLRDLIRNIASLPGLVFLLFIALAVVQVGTTDEAYTLPEWLTPYDLDDLDTIRTLLAAVIGGVFTLTIFAYTMVMNVIDRSISSYSPRLLPLLLSERYHQLILGVGAGTIAHSIILFLGVTEPPGNAHPPVLAAASAGLFAVVSLVLFIYFIHRVSRSIHINVVLYKSYCHTRSRLRVLTRSKSQLQWVDQTTTAPTGELLYADRCGYLDGVDVDELVALSRRKNSPVTLLARPGAFVYRGQAVVGWNGEKTTQGQNVEWEVEISEKEPVDVYATGFKHLVEVAIKAASPAINDPATAMTAVNYLGQLFQHLAAIPPYNAALGKGTRGGLVLLCDWTLPDLLHSCFRELRCYLDGDPWAVDVLRENLLRIDDHCADHGYAEGSAAARRELQELLHKP